jgi:hypothetical protein
LNTYDILVLGPPGPDRAALESTLRRLGHTVTAPDSDAPSADSPSRHDLVVVDARYADPPPLALALDRDGDPVASPVLVVTDRPRRLAPTLAGRPALLVSGAETDRGYQFALRLCAALGTRIAVAGPLPA